MRLRNQAPAAKKALGLALLPACLAVLALVTPSPTAAAQTFAAPLASPSQVTSQPISTWPDDQINPAVACNTDAGGCLVVWEYVVGEGQNDIIGRRVASDGTPLGSEIPIATTDDWESNPDVAYNPRTGEYLVVWQVDLDLARNDINVRRVAADGSLPGSPAGIATSGDEEREPALASYAGSGTGYLVVYQWQAYNGTENDVRGQILDDYGVPQSSVHIATGVMDQAYPDVAGGQIYLVTWQMEDLESGDGDYEIHARGVAQNGTLVGGEQPLSTWDYDQLYPSAAYDSDYDRFVVVWEDRHWAWGEARDLYGQLLDGTAAKVGGNFGIAWDGDEYRQVPAVTYDASTGQYLVAYQYEQSPSNRDIYLRTVAFDGSLPDVEVGVATTTYDEQNPSLACMGDGATMVAWQDERYTGPLQGWKIYGYVVQQPVFSGHVYQGNVGDTTHPLSGVRLDLYCASSPDGAETWKSTVYSNTSGQYKLASDTPCAYYNLRQTNLAGLVSTGATTPGGTVRDDDWIQYAHPLDGKDLSSNNFWDDLERPDLTVTSVWSQAGQICYRLANAGSVVAPAGHSSQLAIDGSPVSSHQVQQSLAPGNTLDLCFAYPWSCSPPDDTVVVRTDYLDQVDEGNEGNNSHEQVLACDTTPPQFTSGPEVSDRTQNSATVTWETDEASDTLLRCGTAPGHLPIEVSDPSFSTDHTAHLTGLTPVQAYYCLARSSDPAGNSAQAGPFVFETHPPPDGADPDIAIADPGSLSGRAIINAVASDDTGISRVIFFLDGVRAYVDFSPPYEVEIDTRLFDNGPHDIVARAVDLAGNEAEYELTVDFANLKDDSWPTVDITSPLAGTAVDGIVQVTADLTDDTGILSARFYVDGDYQQYESFSVDDPPTTATAVFDWDTRSLVDGQEYTLGVTVHDRDSKLESDSVTVVVTKVAPPPPPSPPILQVAGQVVLRDGNRFVVFVTVRNVGDIGAYNVKVRYDMHGFQPIAKDVPDYEVRPEYDPQQAISYADIRSRTGIPAGHAQIFSFYAMPYLLNPDPKDPCFGCLIDMSWESHTHASYWDAELLPVGTVFDGDTVDQAHSAALKTADYLIVTNPWRLFAIYNPSYYQGESIERTLVNDVLSKMAELAYHQNGVLGYHTVYTSESLRDLIKQGGSWSGRLAPGWTDNGYLLLVGEVDVLSAWWRQYGTVTTSEGDWDLIVSYTDYPYASTYGREEHPELILARLIGQSPLALSEALGHHIEKLTGVPGHEFDGDDIYLASGFDKAPNGGSGEIHFKPERDKVASKFVGTKTLLHTPDLSIFQPGGELDVPATEAAIALAMLGAFPGKDIIFLAGHGSPTQWDGFHDRDLLLATNPFGDRIPFVFASACSTAAYANQSSLAEAFLWEGAGAYLGAIRDGLCESRQCALSDIVADKWSKGMSFARALRDTKQLVSVVPYTMPRYWNAIYQLFGDAKFGPVAGYLPPTSATQGGSTSAPSGEVQITVPDYEVTHTEEGDHIAIPGCFSHIVPGQPSVPACQAVYEYPAGVQVQAVEMVARSDAELLTGLDIPIATLVVAGEAVLPPLRSATSPDWWPELDFEWSVAESPLTSTLTIQYYPVFVDVEAGEARYHDHYTFDIQTAESSVEVTGLGTDAAHYEPGQEVVVDLDIVGGESAQDVVVFAWIEEAELDEYADGLLLEMLAGLSGPASFSTSWDTAGAATGNYEVIVELRSPEGLLLDRQMEAFEIGLREAEVLALVATPASFLPGALVHLDVDLQNSGSIPISATVTLDIHDPSAGVLQSFSLPSPELAPGGVVQLEAEWDTTGLEPGRYDVVAFADYGSAATNVLTSHLHALYTVSLPVIKR